MRAVDIIQHKRDGSELSREEIEFLVRGYVLGEVPDYQVSAWLMAVCWRGMSRRELADLTRAMVASGSTLDLSRVPLPIADKHSTGGVGDKTSLVVAPVVRACGVAVGKMSGRGLGFTGGTLDKLESIPGYRVDLTPDEFVAQLEGLGIVLSGQTPGLAPADGKLYALRDVTATVQSLPLIASSIMSKKLAIGAPALVLDVKYGSGAFMSNVEMARELAGLMVEIGVTAGKRVTALLSPMDQPLGAAVGNSLELAEAIEVLCGGGPEDLREVCAHLAGEMLFLAGRAPNPEEGQFAARSALRSGRGLEWLERLVEAQGGDPRLITDPSRLEPAPLEVPVPASRPGWVASVDARTIAGAALSLGAGRATKADRIDHRVGVILKARAGARVEAGQIVAYLHARDQATASIAAAEVLRAYAIQDSPYTVPPLVLERISIL